MTIERKIASYERLLASAKADNNTELVAIWTQRLNELGVNFENQIVANVKWNNMTTGFEFTEEIEVNELGIEMVARLKCKDTKSTLLVQSNGFKNKNQFRKYLKTFDGYSIQAISDNRDLAAMEAGFKNFLGLKKEAQRFNFRYKEGVEYNRILNEVAL